MNINRTMGVTLSIKIKKGSLFLLTRVEGRSDVFGSPNNEFFKRNHCVQVLVFITLYLCRLFKNSRSF